MNVGAVGVNEDDARAYLERFYPKQEKTAAEVRTRDQYVPGEIGKLADAWITENVTKQAAQRLIRRPGRLMGIHEMDGVGSVPQTVPEGVLEEDYTPGAIERLVKQAEGERKMQVTVRTGREAFGRLPDCPDMRERIQEDESVHGAIERLLLQAHRGQEKKAVGATDTMIAGMAGQQGQGKTGPFGPAGSAVDYISRGLMGTGLGRTAGFLLKGRGVPEVIERRLGLIGAVGGLGLAAAAHREQKRLASEREAITRELALQELREAFRKSPPKRIPRSGGEPEKDESLMEGAIVPAVAGGAAGAIVPEVVSALRRRLGSAASAI